jgi:hypothetical protein
MRLIVAILAIIVAAAACSGQSATSTPAASVAPGPSSAASFAASLGELPYTLDLPDSWILASDADYQRWVSDLRASNPTLAERFDKISAASPVFTSNFLALLKTDPSVAVSGNTVATEGLTNAEALDLIEAQNVEGVAQIPGVVGTPTSDRLNLPVGETVRVRWRAVDAYGPGTGDLSSIGYAFVADGTAYTFVFTAPTERVGELEPTFEAILRTFRLRADASSRWPV